MILHSLNHGHNHFLHFGIWGSVGILILFIVILFFAVYAWKIRQYRQSKGKQLEVYRKKYLGGKISKKELIKSIEDI
jgi:uncharacterized membrane protein